VLTCAVGLGVLAAAAACSPVQMGAAATVGSQRITIAQLDSQVTSFNQLYKKYGGQAQLTPAQVPARVLSWLISFQIGEQVARDAGLTVTPADAEAAITALQAQIQQQAAQSGQTATLAMVMAADGIPPDLQSELGRYEAIQIAWVKQHNGGSLPTTTAAGNAAQTALDHAQCTAAKSLSIAVNPQFGRTNYSANPFSYSVVPAPDLLSRASGASSSSPSAVTSPPC
jgi:hypothetical protein